MSLDDCLSCGLLYPNDDATHADYVRAQERLKARYEAIVEKRLSKEMDEAWIEFQLTLGPEGVAQAIRVFDEAEAAEEAERRAFLAFVDHGDDWEPNAALLALETRYEGLSWLVWAPAEHRATWSDPARLEVLRQRYPEVSTRDWKVLVEPPREYAE